MILDIFICLLLVAVGLIFIGLAWFFIILLGVGLHFNILMNKEKDIYKKGQTIDPHGFW